MKYRIVIFCVSVMMCNFISAQVITVKEMKKLDNDISARRERRLDTNDEPCAMIRVLVPMLKGMQFKGVVGDAIYIPGEYDIYVPAGIKRVKFYHEKYPSGTIEFTMPIEKLCVYQVMLNVPNLTDSYENMIAVAREYYNNYPSHTESSFYDAARIAYDNAIEHHDCPLAEREKIRAERDTMASLRRNTYLIESAQAKAKQYENEKGFGCDEVYKYLGGVVRFADRILGYHPEVVGILNIKEQAVSRLSQHPRGKKEAGSTIVVHQREIISGNVSFKNEYMSIPFDKMHVFATSSPKIKEGQSRMIGNVRADGTFSVVRPDGIPTLYIYVTGEKDKAHFVPSGMTQLDIVIK